MLHIPSGYRGENMAHFLDVLEFAREVGATEELLKKLRYLESYACGDDDPERTVCELYQDVTRSFSFAMFIRADDYIKSTVWPTEDHFKKWCEENGIRLYRWHEGRPYIFWFNGGLIYSGPGRPSDGSAPSFTVSLDPVCASGAEHRWSVHT